MEIELVQNYKRYLERLRFYKSFGYDIEKERKFILEKAYPLNGDILEIGTGKGYFSVELAGRGYKFVSIDICEEEQKFAKYNITYLGFEDFVDFRIEDAERLSFNNASFDIIFSVNTIHHLKKPVKAMDELIRVLAFEGKIILSDFTEEGLTLIDKIHTTEGRKHEAGSITLEQIAEYLKSRKFNAKRYRSKFQEVCVAYRQTI